MKSHFHEHLFNWENISAFPILPQKIVYAAHVRNLLCFGSYNALCIELPHYLHSSYLASIKDAPLYLTLGIEEVGRRQIGFISNELSDPFVLAIKTAMALEIPIYLVDCSLPRKIYRTFPDDESVIKQLGFDEFYSTLLPFIRQLTFSPFDYSRFNFIANQLKKYSKQYHRVLFISHLSSWDMIHDSLLRKKSSFDTLPASFPKNIDTFKVSRKSLRNITQEMPFVISHFIDTLKNCPLKEVLKFDSKAVTLLMIQEIFDQSDLCITNIEKKTFFQYLKKLLKTQNRQTPSFNDILMTSKLTLGEEITARFHQLGSSYPYHSHDHPYYIIDFKTRIDDLRFPDSRFERSTRVNHSTLKPLFIKPKKKQSSSYSFIHIRQLKLENKPIELLVDRVNQVILKQIEILPANFQNRVLALPIFNFSSTMPKNFKKSTQKVVPDPEIQKNKNFDEDFPWRDCLLSENNNQLNLLFYANSYTIEFAFPGKSKCRFGGFACFQQAINDINYFDKSPNHFSLPQKLIFWANEIHQNHIIPYLSQEPPDELFLKTLSPRHNMIIHFSSDLFPKRILRELSKLNHLGQKRLFSLLNRV